MKAPVNLKDTEPWRTRGWWVLPDKEWLESQLAEKSINLVADELGCAWRTVDDWIYKLGVEFDRSRIGECNPAWVGGTSRGYGRNLLLRSDVPYRCSWCGVLDRGAYSMHVHHKDHDKHNNRLENLQWLCLVCHRLETALWHLRKSGKAIVEAKGDTITIRFPHLSET